MATALQEAAIDVGSFLEQAHIPYVLIGGFAVQHWGEPRATRDIDIEILVSEEHKEAVFRKILERYRPRYDDALEFALQQRVLLIYASNGVPVDIALAAPSYGELIAQRRQLIQVAPNQPMVAVISAEDLIVHKCLAHRPVDLQDVESILKRQRGKLDIEYIRACLESFAPYVWEFDLIGEFEQLLNRSQ